ncbi:prepilin-type N-terminal cleavage/methylation domain-containing protein [Colwellia chukchiensis]|uniref:Prepilin-type N-terminal cleavage/methylation domain-containing protein n=1 Tax=Colwellia chukchiensis TaxID=641665 RepID=A0A1H7H9N6_9GAMM|nr:prepilin-type N-terminal cleavage/methylation domain-containing protein [Colwellia chukchiensis]SEK47163.1 prepilin-type N-terminal cleavage/methylation domain-containing protein [Colwellia chukchiensis]
MSTALWQRSPQQTNKGFTLIEVLVASFILFLVISAVTMVYRGALLSSFKAERVLTFSAFVAPIAEQISMEIKAEKKEEQLQGSGTMGQLSFTWHASVNQQSKAPEQFNAGSGQMDSGNKTFKLWQVTMQLQLKNAVRNYQFNEISW